MPRPLTKFIHVNQFIIRANKKNGDTSESPVTVFEGRKRRRGHVIGILDGNSRVICEIIYSPEKPLKCGARVYVKTTSPIVVKDANGNEVKEEEGAGSCPLRKAPRRGRA